MEPITTTTTSSTLPAGSILPPKLVDVSQMGIGDLFDLVKKLRELAKKFQGEISFDAGGDALKFVLGLLGLTAEAELADKFVDQLANPRNAIRDENGAEIGLRRLLADRFLPADKAGDFSLLALPEGAPADNREPSLHPLPESQALARLAVEFEGFFGSNVKALAADAPPPTEYDPAFLPPIIWQIGGAFLFEMIKKMIERRLARGKK